MSAYAYALRRCAGIPVRTLRSSRRRRLSAPSTSLSPCTTTWDSVSRAFSVPAHLVRPLLLRSEPAADISHVGTGYSCMHRRAQNSTSEQEVTVPERWIGSPLRPHILPTRSAARRCLSDPSVVHFSARVQLGTPLHGDLCPNTHALQLTRCSLRFRCKSDWRDMHCAEIDSAARDVEEFICGWPEWRRLRRACMLVVCGRKCLVSGLPMVFAPSLRSVEISSIFTVSCMSVRAPLRGSNSIMTLSRVLQHRSKEAPDARPSHAPPTKRKATQPLSDCRIMPSSRYDDGDHGRERSL